MFDDGPSDYDLSTALGLDPGSDSDLLLSSSSATLMTSSISGTLTTSSSGSGLFPGSTLQLVALLETQGTVTLAQSDSVYALYGHGTTTGPQLTYGGAAVTVGQFGDGWAPIGVEASGDGYVVAWRAAGTDQYTIWNVDGAGHFVSNSLGIVSGAGSVLQERETDFAQDLNGDGTIGVTTTVIESMGTTTLAQVANTYFLYGHGTTSGPQFTYGGAPVTVGQFGSGWAPVGVEASGGGYIMAWHAAGTDQYALFTVDGAGHFVSNALGVLSGGSYALQSFEATLGQDLNGDGVLGVPTTIIEALGVTTLSQVGDVYRLGSATLTLGGSAVLAGQFGGWAPIGAEQISGGYEVVWKLAGTDQYQFWFTDSAGNYLSAQSTSGSAAALLFAERTLQQDLNGDGHDSTTTIEAFGSLSLLQVGNAYYLNSGSQISPGIQLTLGGSAVTAGQYPGWQPIAAEQVSGSYRVAWQADGGTQFQIWTVGLSGGFVSMQALSGTSTALQSSESGFHQDLNGDGTIGVAPQVIESDGATALTKIGDAYYLGASGPQLKFNGAAVTPDQFPGWTPIGADNFRVAWKHVGTDEYKIWTVDFAGNYFSGNATVLFGAGVSLQAQEVNLQQDLNGDGTIGIKTTVIENVGASVLTQRADTYQVDGIDLNVDGQPVKAGQYPGWSPVGAERAEHTLVWQQDGGDQYRIWSIGLSGNYLSEVTVSAGSAALHAAETVLGQDLDGDGTIGAVSALIESIGGSSLSLVNDAYVMSTYLGEVVLKYQGTTVTTGQFAGWEAVGAESVGNSTAFRVVWKHAATDEYKIWTTDTDGNYVSGDEQLYRGKSYDFQFREFTFSGQDVNGDGVVGVKKTLIENAGSSKLEQVADEYSVGGSTLTYGFNDVTVGMFPGWSPVGAETAYDLVVWKFDGADQYSISSLDSFSDVVVTGASWALQSAEAKLSQDLNGDGRIGPELTVIESQGGTTLYQAQDAFVVQQNGAAFAPDNYLRINGQQVIAGQDDWTPIGAELVVGTNTYEVVWKNATTGQYKIWIVDADGDHQSGNNVVLAPTAATLTALEYDFQQDLNGDGQSLPVTVIDATGATKLVQVGNVYEIVQGAGVSPRLTYQGAAVTAGQFSGWTPIAVEAPNADSFYVVWQNSSADQYKIWMTNAHGLMLYDYGAMAGSDWLLRTVEETLGQDVNGDSVVGLPDSPFDITLNISGNHIYDLYFEAAANRWEQIITADLPDVVSDEYGAIDDLRIDVTVAAIDGSNGTLASASPDEVRDDSWLPLHGDIVVDSVDIGALANSGRLVDTIVHEIGHVLGIGTLWSALGLTDSFGYVGQYGLEAYRELSDDATATFVPLESGGGIGTAGVHWSESVFGSELMTGFLSASGGNPLSILIIAALRDLGYSVDETQADPYTLPAGLVAA